MNKNLKLKLGNNLFVVGQRVISYRTQVGQIVGDELITCGGWTLTTSKHIHKAAGLLGLRVVKQKKAAPFFYQYHNGVKIETPPGCMSAKASLAIAQKIGENRAKGIVDVGRAILASCAVHNSADRVRAERVLTPEQKKEYEALLFLHKMGLAEVNSVVND